MNITDENNDELSTRLKKWINGLSKESTSKIYSVCNILRSISELSNKSIFSLPYATFEKTNIDLKSVEIILTELWRKEVIDLMEFGGERFVSSWNREFELDNSFCDSTMVDVSTDLFDYIFQVLQNKKTKKTPKQLGNRIEYQVNNGVLSMTFFTSENKDYFGTFNEGNRTYELMMFLINKWQKTIPNNLTKIELTNKTISVSCPDDWKDYQNLTTILKSTISDIRKAFGIKVGKKMKSSDVKKRTDIITGKKWVYTLNVDSINCKN